MHHPGDHRNSWTDTQRLCGGLCDNAFSPIPSLDETLRSLRAINTQIGLFKDTFAKSKSKIDYFSYTEKQLSIIKEAQAGKYTDESLEGAFYKYGREKGIVAVLWYCSKSGNILKQWKAIYADFRPWLVQHAVELLGPQCDILIQKHYAKVLQSTPKYIPALPSIHGSTKRHIDESAPQSRHDKYPKRGNMTASPSSGREAANQVASISSNICLTAESTGLSREAVITRFGCLDQKLKDFLGVFIFLNARISQSFQVSIKKRYSIFSRNGEASLSDAIRLSGPFTETQFDSVIVELRYLQLISSIPEPEPLTSSLHTNKETTIYVIAPELNSYILESTPTSQIRLLKIQALKLVCHIFPTYTDILKYDFAQVGRQLSPYTEHVLRYPITDLIKAFSSKEIRRFIEFCLSFSTFSTPKSKQLAINTAEEVMDIFPQSPLLLARCRLRRMELARLFPIQQAPVFNIKDQESNAYFGNQVLFDAQQAINHRQHQNT